VTSPTRSWGGLRDVRAAVAAQRILLESDVHQTPTSDALRKKTWRIGSGLGETSENLTKANFENPIDAKFAGLDHLPHSPARRAYPRGHNTAERYYRSLMYFGLRTSDTLHKKSCRIGAGVCGTSATEQSGPKTTPLLCTLLGNSGTRPGLCPLRLLLDCLSGFSRGLRGSF
jgi:hypothetical protein